MICTTFWLLIASAALASADNAPPKPTLVFGTTIRIAEAYAIDEGATAGDGCIEAESRLKANSGSNIHLVFDANNGRMKQSNAQLPDSPVATVTNIGKWDHHDSSGHHAPRQWDITNTTDGNVTCVTEALPPVMCPNGNGSHASCLPKFGSWGGLNPFTSIVGMFYPNTSKSSSTPTTDTYQFTHVRETVLANEACRTSTCTMEHCSSCKGSSPCTQCPCDNCMMEVNVTQTYTYTVAKEMQKDGTHQMTRYQWTQGMPFTKSGAVPGVGRDCFIFDWSQGWTADVSDSDFEPPEGAGCSAA